MFAILLVVKKSQTKLEQQTLITTHLLHCESLRRKYIHYCCCLGNISTLLNRMQRLTASSAMFPRGSPQWRSTGCSPSLFGSSDVFPGMTSVLPPPAPWPSLQRCSSCKTHTHTHTPVIKSTLRKCEW